MINKKKYLLILLFLLIITIPISFANDNITGEAIGEDTLLKSDTMENNVSLSSDDDEIVGAGEVYFDASASSGGDGTQSRPYNTVTSSYLGTTNHFAPGTYRISSSLSSYSYEGISFIGSDRDNTILQYTGSDTFLTSSYGLTFSTITLKGCSIVSTGGSLTATNTIFDGGVAKEETESDNYKYGNSYGGTIKKAASSSSFDWGDIFGGGGSTDRSITLDNCIFRNNRASYGGAIYAEKCTVTITNTLFENNRAENGGGAIAALNGVKLTVRNSEFIKDSSLYDAGGAVYLFNATSASIEGTDFNNCSAGIGGAVASLITPVTLTGSNFNSNNANWTGGAVFAMYGSLTSTSSNYHENTAYNGGGIYADNLTRFVVNNGVFKGNVAVSSAGAIFAFTNLENRISNPTYISNRAGYKDDLYQTDRIELVLGSEDYEMIQYKPSYTGGALPARYDLRTLNGVTPVKDQGQSGNCWAFATMATLESAILKATGKQVILSEGNLKNLANIYSDIGWKYETNNGGMYPFAFGYLTSWAGPVLASLDPTDDWDVIAPIINSAVHVQNILFLQRTSFTDNNAIKKAIMDYGAVCSEIYWSSSYLNGNNYYYNGNEGRNHAISVVGWDDSRSISGAPAAGAWIIKNSYGSHRGDGGYYYVSYYDKSLFRVYDESYNSFAVVFNDTIRFNKNYQYDASFTDYFLTPSMNKVMWYKNTFTSTGNDILQAFSTYFRKVTTWEAEIYLNNQLVTTQNGKSNPGYYTINLNNPISLKTGDTFTVSLKISCSSSADIPISEAGPAYTLVKEYFKPGVSFFSTDGVAWTDFYGYSGSFGSGETGHNYFNQVACIKAFTSEGPKEFLNTTIEIVSVNSTGIKVKVLDQRGNQVNTGVVEFIIDGERQTSMVSDSLAILNAYLKPGNHNIKATYLMNDYYNVSTVATQYDLDKETPEISIAAEDISFGQDLSVKVTLTNAIGEEISIPFTVEINGEEYGEKEFKVSNLSARTYAISVLTQATDDYNSKSASKTVRVLKVRPTLNLEIADVDVGDEINIHASLSNRITGTVNVEINSQDYQIKVYNGVGNLTIGNNYSYGQYAAVATFEGTENYLNATTTKLFNVKRIKPIIHVSAEGIVFGQNATVRVILPDDISEALTLTIDSRSIEASPDNGEALFNVEDLKTGKYSYSVSFKGNAKYEGLSVTGEFEVLEKAKKEASFKVTDSVHGNSLTIDVELSNDATGQVILEIAELTFTKSPVNGKTSFRVNDLDNGVYNYTVRFLGDDEYKSSSLKKSIVINEEPPRVDSTIRVSDMSRAYNSAYDFEATFSDEYGNPLADVEVLFIVNGNDYYVKTNNYGIARLAQGFPVGSFRVEVYNLATGENTTKIMNIVDRISQNRNVNMDYGDNALFKVRVHGDNADVVGAGEQVSFKVDGKIFYAKTDSNGYAYLKLDLKPKTYTITTTYKGVSVSNKIVVKHVLKAKNLSKKKAKKIRFTATLKSSKGKAIVGKKVTFKIKGKKYTAKTNKRGKATITIRNLKVGKYRITSTYLGDVVSNTIKIKR